MRLLIHFTSDWHIGTGRGIPGSVDRQVLLDQDGLPYVPGKTLVGVLRDGAEMVARALDSSDEGPWSKVLRGLFGGQTAAHKQFWTRTSSPARLSVGSAFLRPALRERLAQDDALKRALRFLQPGVKISIKTGRAEEDHLFLTERVRKGATLEATLGPMDPNDPLKPCEIALLVAAATAVERLGGKRRRGSGRCFIEILDLPLPPDERSDGEASMDRWLSWLEEHASDGPNIGWSQAATTGRSTSSGLVPGGGETRSQTGWVRIPLHLLTLTPVIIPSETLGNLVETRDDIPGTYLMAYLFSQMGRRVGDDEGFRQLQQAIAAGNLVVTPLYPEVNGRPSRPVPLCWSRLKEGRGLDSASEPIYCSLTSKWIFGSQDGAEPQTGCQRKDYRQGFIAKVAGRPGYLAPKSKATYRMHNTILDEIQRPHEEVGGVFTYRAVQPGVTFHGEVLALGGIAAAFLAQLQGTTSEIRLGRSKKDEYGRASLHVGQVSPLSAPEVQPFPEDNDLLVVYVHSPVLLRDERLRPTAHPDQLRKELGRRLGIELAWVDSRQSPGLRAAFTRAERIESWNRSWNLPRPSLVGPCRGSVFVFRIADRKAQSIQDVLKQAATLQVTGIGERRAEGYGRIEFNPPWLWGGNGASSHEQDVPAEPPVSASGDGETRGSRVTEPRMPLQLDAADERYLKQIERFAWEEKILRRIRTSLWADNKVFGRPADSWEVRGEIQPSVSQWGSLRAAATAALSLRHLQPLQQWLASVEANKNRKELWNTSTNEGFDVLQSLISEEDHVWHLLGLEDAPQNLRRDLQYFAVGLLIQETCAYVASKSRHRAASDSATQAEGRPDNTGGAQ